MGACHKLELYKSQCVCYETSKDPPVPRVLKAWLFRFFCPTYFSQRLKHDWQHHLTFVHLILVIILPISKTFLYSPSSFNPIKLSINWSFPCVYWLSQPPALQPSLILVSLTSTTRYSNVSRKLLSSVSYLLIAITYRIVWDSPVWNVYSSYPNSVNACAR